MTMDLLESLSGLLEAEQVDLWGIADLRFKLTDIARFTGKNIDLTTAIPMGCRIRSPLVDQVDQVPARGKEYYLYYNRELLHEMSQRACRVRDFLKNAGFKARVIPNGTEVPSATVEWKDFVPGLVKIAARLAGLGWIGKNCMLVNPAYGPRVGWALVLTNAELATRSDVIDRRCGSCTRCVDSCPVHAYTGIPFVESDPPEQRFLTDQCRAHRKQLGPDGDCCICMKVCPWGQKIGVEQGHAEATSRPARSAGLEASDA